MSWEHGAAVLLDAVHERNDALYGIELLVYDELREILRSRSLHYARPLQPRDVVAVLFARFFDTRSGSDGVSWFYRVAAGCLRRILLEHARARVRSAPLDWGSNAIGLGFLRIDRRLTALAAAQPRCARIAELHYFAGCNDEEIADMLGLGIDVVATELRFARAWLAIDP